MTKHTLTEGMSLQLMPSVQAYLVMGRLDLAERHIEDARYDVEEALKIQPGNKPALDLRQQVEAVGAQSQ